MIVLYFRSSSYNQYDYCEMSYFLTYNLGWQQPTSRKANLGTITHKVLECLAQCKQRLQYGEKRSMKIDDGELGEIKFTKKQLYSSDFVKTLTDMSYDYYTTNDPGNQYDRKADYKFCSEMVEAAISHNKGQFDPRNRNVISPEPHFDIPIMEPWAQFDFEGQPVRLAIKGTIDLVTEVDSDTIEVIDWKTGQRKDWATGEIKDYAKLEKDAQLLLYHYAVLKLFPTYKQAIMSIFFLRDGGPFSLCFDSSDKTRFLGNLKDRFYEIRKNQLPKPINHWRSDFRCKRLCHFYKTNWPGTDKPMCNYVEDHIKLYGIDKTQITLKNPNFTLGHYSAPGSIENR